MTGVRQVVIVGAGVTGLLTAIECALAGHRVTVLDRGAIPDPRSSSYDQHRVMRLLVPGDPAATRARIAAHRRWLALETLLGTRFYRRVGVVTAWPRDRVAGAVATAISTGVAVETVSPEKLPYLGVPAGSTGVLEVDAGVLLAEQVLRAAVAWLAARPSVTLRPWCTVTGVDPAGLVTMAGETLGADLVLVAAGPWTGALLGHPVVLHRQTMAYLRPPSTLARWWEHAPAAGGLGVRGAGWVVPPGSNTLLKISSDVVCREVSTTDGEDSRQLWMDRLVDAHVLSDMDRYAVVATRTCHYATDGDTGGARLVRVGPAVWSRPACGGTGFGTAPLVAGHIVEAVREEEKG